MKSGDIRGADRVIVPDAPTGHRYYVEIPRTHEEVFEAAYTCEPLERARRRLGPRVRCECGRGFGNRASLDDHHIDPLRDERDRADR